MVLSLWWQLPGPRTFIETIIEDLREGRNVVILLPKFGPQNYGLIGAVREAWREDGAIELLRVPANQTPIRTLTERYTLPLGVVANPQAISELPDFCGRVLWVDGLEDKAWAGWKEFLTEYQHFTRNISLVRRTLFITPVTGEAARTRIQADVGLAVRRWDGVTERADMLLFAMYAIRRYRYSGRLAALLAATIAHTAVFDPEVVVRLAAEPPQQIISPTGILLDIARERQWDTMTPQDWALGTSSTVEGHQEPHPALEALVDGIERRLWHAQVTVLFPLIEEHRLRLVARLRPHLRVPFETPFGVITDPRDLASASSDQSFWPSSIKG